MGKLKETLPEDWAERCRWIAPRRDSFMRWLERKNPVMHGQIMRGERPFKDHWIEPYPGDLKKGKHDN